MFLPAAGYRYVTNVGGVGNNGNYWSSTANNDNNAWNVNFNENNVNPDGVDDRSRGQSVRLVCE